MKLQRCWTLTRFPVQGTWYRAVFRLDTGQRPSPTPRQSPRAPAAFTTASEQRPGFPAIYLTDDPQVHAIRSALRRWFTATGQSQLARNPNMGAVGRSSQFRSRFSLWQTSPARAELGNHRQPAFRN